MPDSENARPHVQLFTDGACLGNPGPGGWAYILRHPETGKEVEEAFGEDHTTNNRMELTAVIRGLDALAQPSRVTLIGDSQYVLKGLTEWMVGWKKRNWRTSAKKPVLNVDLWKQLDELAQKHTVDIEWVRGHTGHPENERCDQLATAQAQMIKEGQA
jgi:ribonuclease HI